MYYNHGRKILIHVSRTKLAVRKIEIFCHCALNLLIYVSCRITFPETSSSSKKRKHDEEEPKGVDNQDLLVEPFVVPNRGPYPFNQPKK